MCDDEAKVIESGTGHHPCYNGSSLPATHELLGPVLLQSLFSSEQRRLLADLPSALTSFASRGRS